MLYFLVALVLFIAPATAHAYIDPGAGSSVIQVFIASLVGGFFGIKMVFKRFWDQRKRKSK